MATGGPVSDNASRRFLAEVYVRSLGLQGSWNAQRMQNLGFLVSLLPWLRRRNDSRDFRRRFCRRHYEYFNTNPYLANLIVGGVLRLEADAAGGTPDEGLVEKFKDSLARSTASLGDQLFWLGVQPSVLLLVCLLAFWGHPWWGVGVVGTVALLQLELRRRLLLAGWRLGLDVVDLLARPGWHRSIGLAKRVGMVSTGALLGAYLGSGTAPDSAASVPQIAGTVVAGLGLALVFRKRVPAEFVFLLAGPLVLLLTFV